MNLEEPEGLGGEFYEYYQVNCVNSVTKDTTVNFLNLTFFFHKIQYITFLPRQISAVKIKKLNIDYIKKQSSQVAESYFCAVLHFERFKYTLAVRTHSELLNSQCELSKKIQNKTSC